MRLGSLGRGGDWMDVRTEERMGVVTCQLDERGRFTTRVYWNADVSE